MKVQRVFILIFFLLVGCQSAPKIEPTGYSANDFWQDQSNRKKSWKSQSAKFKMYYEWEGESASGSGQWVSLLPDKLRLALNDLFGRQQYLVVANGKDFVAHYPSQHLAYKDDNGGRAYLERVLGTPYQFVELQALLLGILPKFLSKGRFESWSWDSERGLYRGELKVENRISKVYVDPERNALSAIEIESPAQDWRVIFEDFESCCQETPGFHLANRVVLQSAKPKVAIEMNWRDLKPLTHPPKEAAFEGNLPKGTKTVRLH